MASPMYVDAGTGATDAGSDWSYTCQAAAAAGNLFIVQVLQDGVTSNALAVTGSTNINNLAGSAGWTQLAEMTFGLSSYLFVGRSTSTSAPTISGTNTTSEDLYIRSYQFKNVNTGTTLSDICENVTAGSWDFEYGSGAMVSDNDVTTLGADRLPLQFVFVGDDNTIAAFGSYSGGYWWQQNTWAESSGTDGAISLSTGRVGVGSWGNNGNEEAVYGGSGTGEAVAQSFQCPAATYRTVYAKIRRWASPTDNLVCEVQTDNGGEPSGTVVGTGGSRLASEFDNVAPREEAFSINATLSASTTYWLVFTRSGSRDVTNYATVNVQLDDRFSGYSATRDSGTWNTALEDTSFLIEPSGGTLGSATASITDSDPWMSIGVALIGTTAAAAKSLLRPVRHHLIHR